MKEWKKYKLGELITLKYGKDHKKLNDGSFPVYGSGGVMRYGNDYIYDDSSILIPRKGSLNNIMFVDKPFWTVDTMFWSIIDQELVLPRFLYYTLCKYDFAGLNVGSAVPSLTVPVIESIEVVIPSIEKQKRILSLLVPLDDKIALNQRINDNLEQQAQALFKSWFVDFEPFKDGKFVDSELGMIPEGWKVCAASDIFDINIGKTPPRKEQEWFSTEKNQNVTWVSISDMGNNGMFISDSSEYLTKEAVSKFNIIIVPNNTILLSFKLTIGRVAICNSELTTNEAIARFYLPNDSFREYLYLALKDYDYTKLGSTSSIATAVNSKIIKNMLMLSPGNKVIQKFSSLVNPLFETIKLHQDEICNLSLERDTLLPKLMSGELKVNDLNN